MIKLKIKLALLTAVLSTTTLLAQNPFFGIKAGANFARMTLKDNDGWVTNKFNLAPGVNAGFVMDYRIIPELTLNVSLQFSTKGYQEKLSEDFKGITIESINSLQLFYVDLPIVFKTEFDLGSLDPFIGAGGYVGYGYWGKYRWRRTGGSETEWGKEDVLWGEDPDLHDYKNLDYGATIMGGVKFDNFVLDIGYNLGIANISANTDNGQVARNGVFFASVNYFFSRFYKYSQGNF